MRTYPEVRLAEVLELELEQVSVDPARTYEIAGVYGFGKGLFHRSTIEGSDTSYKRLNILRSDRFVMSRLKAFEGATAIVAPQFEGHHLSPEFPTFKLDERAIAPSYMGLVTRWPEFWERLRAQSRGVGARRERVHPEQLYRVSIPLPGRDEQYRIVAKLDRILSAVDRLASSSSGQQGRVLELAPILADSVFSSAASDLVPLSELVDVVPDVMQPGEPAGLARDFVGLQHIESHTGRQLGSLPTGGEKGAKRRFAPGDLVYGNLRPNLNKVWVADHHGVCSVDQRVLRPKPGVSAALVGHALRTHSFLARVMEHVPNPEFRTK